MTSRSTLLAALVALLLALPAGAEAVAHEVAGELKALDLTQRTAPPFMPARRPLELSTDPSGPYHDARAGTIGIAGLQLSFVLHKSSAEATAHDRLWVDLDGDGEYSEAEKRTIEPQTRPLRDGSSVVQGMVLDLEATSDGRTWPFAFLYAQRGEDPLEAQVIGRWYLQATVDVGEKGYDFFAQDEDLDGSFGGETDLWIIEVPGTRQRPASAMSASAFGEGRFLDGARFTAQVGPDRKVRLLQDPATGPDPKDEAAHRARVEHSWMERFDGEREQFVQQRQIDVERPRTETPIAWRFVTFDEALAAAKQANKPLFVDLLAFWCVWCYRMDYYTYPDAEVARLLNDEFIPVKIVQEQDRGNDYQRLMSELGARGIPAMGIWSPDGKLLRFIGGWKKPADFVEELQAALEPGEGDEPAEESGGG